MKAPLFLPFICLLAGIFFGQNFAWGAVYFGLVLLFVALGYFSAKPLFVFLAFFALGGLLIQDESPSDAIKNYLKVPVVQSVSGQIISQVEYNRENDFYSFTLDLDSVAGVPFTGKVRFTMVQPDLEYGQVIEGVAELRRPEGVSNPSGFDYAEYLAQKKIYTLGRGENLFVVKAQKGNLCQRGIYKLREFLLEWIEQRCGKNSPFLQTILLGKKMEDQSLRESFVKAGVAHILAISGLHIGFIALVSMLLLRMVCSRMWLVYLATALFLLLYAAICDFAPSVTRASLMISLVLWARHLERLLVLDNIVAAAGLIILLIQPENALSISFQLSFLAVLVLANLVPRFHLRLGGLERKRGWTLLSHLLSFVVASFVCSLVLCVTMLPITLFYFNQVNFNSVFANLICVPLVGFIIPLSLVCLMMPAFLAEYYSLALNFLIDLLIGLVDFFAEFPFCFGNISSDYFFSSLFSLLLAFAGGYFLWKKKRWKLALSLFLVAALPWSFSLVSGKRDLQITFFDCGLGDMTLITTPEGKHIFVDVGPPDFVRSFSKTALPYLADRGIKKIDYLVITHAHNDHFGGVWHAFAQLDIEKVVITRNFCKSRIWGVFEKAVQKEGSQLLILQDTAMLYVEKDLTINAVHPAKDFWDEDINNMSIVLRVDYREFSALLTGDLEKEGEEFLLPRFDLDCDLLKVGHHGSKSSSTRAFIQEVSPEYAFIFTSVKNRFHFPHSKTLRSYDFLQDNLFITGSSGAIEIMTDGYSAHFKTYKSGRDFTDYSLED